VTSSAIRLACEQIRLALRSRGWTLIAPTAVVSAALTAAGCGASHLGSHLPVSAPVSAPAACVDSWNTDPPAAAQFPANAGAVVGIIGGNNPPRTCTISWTVADASLRCTYADAGFSCYAGSPPQETNAHFSDANGHLALASDTATTESSTPRETGWTACITRWNNTRAREDGKTLYDIAYQSLGADPAVAINYSVGKCLIAIRTSNRAPQGAAMGFESDSTTADFGQQQLVQMPSSSAAGWYFSGMNPDGTIG
jgi:hypothetical protein